MLDITSESNFNCETRTIRLDGPTLLCASQDKIEISFDEDGTAAITQSRWPDEDQTIVVSRDNITDFIDRLTDALGIPAFGGR